MKILQVTDQPFAKLISNLKYAELGTDVEKVIKNLVPNQNTIETQGGSWFYVRIMLYRTLDHRIDGLVFTLIDIIETKKAKETLLIQNRYTLLFESSFHTSEGWNFLLMGQMEKSPT